MGFYDCMSAVVAALGRRITIEEFDALYQRLDDERHALFGKGYPADWLAVSRAVAQQIAIEKAIAQRLVIHNKRVHGEGRAFIAAARARVDAGDALTAIMVGINTPIAGGRMSVAAEAHGLWTTSLGAMLADLRRAGGNSDRLVKLMFSPAFELEIARALRGEPAHPDAKTIAEAIDKVREDLRRQENQAGGWRGRLEGYVSRMSHDSLRVRRQGFEAWRDYILPLLDHERTFERQEAMKAELRRERGQVLQHRFAAGRELAALNDDLRALDKLDNRATKAGRRIEGENRRVAGQIEEAHKAMTGALGRYIELAETARVQQKEGGARGAAPLLGEAGTQEVTARQMTEARVALSRARERLADLRERASAGRWREDQSDLVRQDLAERIEHLSDAGERVERQIELLHELAGKQVEYDKRLQGAIDPETLLRSIYNAIAADTWLSGKSEAFKGELSKIGPANLARRRAAHRELHFKSAEAEVDYMRRFGAGGLADSVIREIEGAGNAIALYRRMTTNPEAMLSLWRTELLQEAKETGNTALARAVNRKRLDWQLAEITGVTRQVGNPTLAAWSASIRVVQSMAKLGGAMLSSFGDVATAASELRYEGRGALDSYGAMFAGLMKGRRKGEQRAIADLLGVGFETMTGQVLARLGGESAPPGGLARAASLFFRLNGLAWWTDTHKTTAGLVIARYFATAADTGFAELPAPTQRLLRQYAIEPAQWDLLRAGAVNRAEDGTAFLTPEGVKGIGLDRFMDARERAALKVLEDGPPSEEAMAAARALIPSERTLRERRDRLASKYAALVTDRVEVAVPTPGARERALMNLGTERGDVLGEALRFVMQFKGFAVGVSQKVIGRDIYGGEGGGMSATARVAWLAFQLTIFGYMSMSAKQLLQGRNPRDPQHVDTWVAAMAQGGGMGILGDFAFGEFNRFGRSALATAAGPTFGTVDDLFELWAKARDTDKMARGGGKYGADMAASSLRLVASNTPFASLFWLRPALNYLALYPVQESLSPGYLGRMERRIERENKQTFWLRPSEVSR